MSANELAPPLPWTARAASHPWATLAVVLTGTFMVVLDFFIVNVAMPAMQADLHAGTGAIEWVIAGYGLTFATFLITAGRLGDQLGRRRMFSLGLAVVHAGLGGLRPGAEPRRARRGAPGPGAGGRAAQPAGAVDHRRRLQRSRTRPRDQHLRHRPRLRRRRRPAHRRRPRAGRHRRPGLAQLLPHQRPGRPRRADGRRAHGARVARRGRPPPGPRGDRADHPRPRRHRPAARRGSPARLARVDVAVPGRGPADPGPVRRRTSGA